ncbi:MAG: FAD-binding oxidoreductase, partial [Rhodobacter sp.]|nr:FAD-binding oxidoreductase [Rhodobacter sp.]
MRNLKECPSLILETVDWHKIFRDYTVAGFTKRALIFGAGAAAGVAGTRYFSASNPSLDGTASLGPSGAANTLNDASLLSETPIFRHITMTQDPGDALVDAIRRELAEATSEGRPVNVGAARHSMGGQAIPRDGHAVTFDSRFLQADTDARRFRAHAGIRWSDVIAQLDPLGYSPMVMQSNHDFGVAATFCVNAHGWPVKLGPMGATVRSFGIVLADGAHVTCSRSENADLFGLTMGGYGLCGVITEVEVDMTENLRLEPAHQEFSAAEFGERFIKALADDTVKMAYGRLNVDRAAFFEQALMITYRPAADQSDLPAAAGSGAISKIARHVYRAQLGNERIKRLRWWTETDLGPMLGSGPVTRNSLINEPVATLDDRDPTRTDILHEYFVSPDRFPEFLDVCRAVIPASYQEFLNVTLRFIDTDGESVLAYAPVPRIAAVMSFSQEMTARAEADMTRMTQNLIDGITAIGGT